MQFGRLPGIDKPISRLVQGTASYNSNDLDACYAALDTAYEFGFNTFDTAAVYGEANESMLGGWIASRNLREKVVVLGKGAHHNNERRRVTPDDITEDIALSLSRQNTGYIDLYVLHRDDPSYPVGPIVERLNKHKTDGEINAFGGSNWTHDRIAAANDYAREQDLTPFAVSSPNFSLAEQVEEPWGNCVSISGPQGEAARAWYQENKVPLFTWSSLAGGFFSDRYHRDNLEALAESGGSKLCIRCYCYEQNFQRLDRARELGKQKDLSVPQVALAFVLNQPMEIFPLVFCANRDEYAANVAALDVKLTPQEMAWLDLKADSPS